MADLANCGFDFDAFVKQTMKEVQEKAQTQAWIEKATSTIASMGNLIAELSTTDKLLGDRLFKLEERVEKLSKTIGEIEGYLSEHGKEEK